MTRNVAALVHRRRPRLCPILLNRAAPRRRQSLLVHRLWRGVLVLVDGRLDVRVPRPVGDDGRSAPVGLGDVMAILVRGVMGSSRICGWRILAFVWRVRHDRGTSCD